MQINTKYDMHDKVVTNYQLEGEILGVHILAGYNNANITYTVRSARGVGSYDESELTPITPPADDVDARALKQIEKWKAAGYTRVHVRSFDKFCIPAPAGQDCPKCHPFDSPEARAAVRAWLVAQDKEKADAGH